MNEEKNTGQIKKRKYIEDEFDLDEFRQKAYVEKNANARKRKSKKTASIISFLLIIIAVLSANILYQVLDFIINLLRNTYMF